MRATLEDLVFALTKDMSAAEMAKTALHIQIRQMIHDTRRAKGWTQKDLAEKMGVKQSLVSRWESGDCNYTIDTLIDIADALGLSVQCPLTFEEVSVPVQPVPVRPQSAHTVVSENMEFSNIIRLDFRKVTDGGAA